jgi:hypothetical protein
MWETAMRNEEFRICKEELLYLFKGMDHTVKMEGEIISWFAFKST